MKLTLTTEQTKDLPFPLGCPVWYNFPSASDLYITDDEPPILKRGIVQSVSLNIVSRDMLYKVVYKQNDNNGKVIEDEVLETELAFGSNCPVTIDTEVLEEENDENNNNVPSETKKMNSREEGTVLYCEQTPAGIVYTVMIFMEGYKARYETGITKDRIKYRTVNVIDSSSNGGEAVLKTQQVSNANAVDKEVSTVPTNEVAVAVPSSITLEREDREITNDYPNKKMKQSPDSTLRGDTISAITGPVSSKVSVVTSSNTDLQEAVSIDNASSTITNEQFKTSMPQRLQQQVVKGHILNLVVARVLPNGSKVGGLKAYSQHEKDAVEDILREYMPNRTNKEHTGRGAEDGSRERNVWYERKGTHQSKEECTHMGCIIRVQTNSGIKGLLYFDNGNVNEITNEHYNTAAAGTIANANEGGTKIDITVPMFLQRDRNDQERIFSHLLGRGEAALPGFTQKRSVVNIARETNCKICINYNPRAPIPHDGRPLLPPITITVKANSSPNRSYTELREARLKIQELLLDFVGRDGCRGRLVYEAALSCWGAHRPKKSTSRAVQADDPLNGAGSRGRFMTVLPLPYIRGSNGGRKVYHAANLLVTDIQRRLTYEANSYVKLVGNEFKVPCNCEPHVLVMGSSFQGVDKGAKIVKEVVRDHMRVCSCRMD